MDTILMTMLTASATGVVTGVASSYATVIALKTDMQWLKKLFDGIAARVEALEKKS
ncbi:hypothetical protein [Vibrio cincinnatiensis]|uniref:hypothetical protein n=1 Tax=Vibrio cincinnatiensis TaxID=675 RepID=UPI001EDEC855|nr:hypothetical protein [Vibrio cincinnatiensis]